MSYNIFAPAGKCQFCGCTEENACTLPEGGNCSWMHRTRNVCSSGPCMRRYHDELKSMRPPKKRTPAEVHELIRRRGRKPVKRPLKRGKQ